MFNRLTVRLVLSHLLVITVAMTLLSFLLLSLVQGYFTQAFQQSLITQARLTAQALIGAPGAEISPNIPAAQNAVQQQQSSQISISVQNTSPNFVALQNTTIRLTSELETRIRVLDTRGIVLVDSAGSERGQDLSGDSAVRTALSGAEALRMEGDWVFVAVPLRRDGHITGALSMGQPLRDVLAVLADLRIRLFLSAALSLVLSAMVGWALARAIARPVRELTNAAHQLAHGDFDYPLNVRTPLELGELATAFRSMSGDLQRMLQARTDLISNVSHELRTPLTAIKGLIETLRDGAIDDLTARDQFLASIESETDRLIRLVNDLLLLSRVDSQALTLDRESFDLGDLARECVSALSAFAASRKVGFVMETVPSIVHADADRIRQVIVNLLDNAIRYSPPGEVVQVCVSFPASGPIVAIHNGGPGISKSDQARVFERFYRADKSRVREASGAAGSGLGLAIARALVEAHGGQIALQSSSSNGTTVSFNLPAS